MKQLKNSLVVFASLFAITGVVTYFIPSLAKGQKSDNVPKSAFSVSAIGGGQSIVIGPDPEGTSYAITSLTITNFAVSPGGATGATLEASWGITSDCISFAGGFPQTSRGPVVSVPPGETVHLSFPQPFILSAKPGASSCLTLSSFTTAYTVVGYRF